MSDVVKICVNVLTYKQENLLPRCLDSILREKDYIQEVNVFDDCSPDGTWGVVEKYMKDYPGIVKGYRNAENLGIMRNIEQSWSKATGDIVVQMDGDDEFCDGFFQKVSEFIVDNKIDYKNELFCIYSNFKVQHGNGISKIIKNNKIVTKGLDLIRLKVRYIILSRACVFSRKIMDKFHHVKELEGCGEFIDGLYEIQLQEYSEKSYYLDYVSSIYYSNIGITATADVEEIIRSCKAERDIFPKLYKMNDKDIKFLEYNYLQHKLRYKFNIKEFVKCMKYWVQSIEPEFGIKGLGLYYIATLFYRIIFGNRK